LTSAESTQLEPSRADVRFYGSEFTSLTSDNIVIDTAQLTLAPTHPTRSQSINQSIN